MNQQEPYKKFDNNSKGMYTTHLHRKIVALKFG